MSEASIETPEVESTEEVGNNPAVEELKARNSGLQRKLQETLAELTQLRASATPEHVAERESMPEEVTADVQSALEGLADEVLSLKREKWQNEAVSQFPQVAPLRDFLQGNDRDTTLALAKDIAERLGAGQKPAEAVAEATEEAATPAPNTPPVPAGAPAVTGPDAEDELAALRLEAKRNPGNDKVWSALLGKKYEQLGLDY